MIPYEVFTSYDTVTEDWLKSKMDIYSCELNVKNLLIRGEIFKKAGLEPVYMVSPDGFRFVVSSAETSNEKKLN
jgi:hypothetical protein